MDQHGELAIETVDALEAYGNALLKTAIAQSAVLGGEASSEKVKTEDQGKCDLTVYIARQSLTPTEFSHYVASADAAPSAPESSTASTSQAGPSKEPVTASSINFHFSGDAEDDDNDDEEEPEGVEDPQGNGGGDGQEAAEDQDDLETAWNILDSARTILSKESRDERKLQLARVHCSMAEVATESGRPEDGVTEYESALKIQKAILPPWDRLVAQTHLFTALALELVPNSQFGAKEEEAETARTAFSKAVEQVQEAKKILKARELHIQGVDLGKGKNKEGDGVAANAILSERDQAELSDLEELQIDLDNKVNLIVLT